MKARYTGDADGVTEAFGVTFEEGEAFEVPAYLEAKVKANRFFSVSGGESPKAPEPKLVEVKEPLEAKHRGRGNYSIMRGDAEVKEGLSKADADTFNALSDDEKTAYVADDK